MQRVCLFSCVAGAAPWPPVRGLSTSQCGPVPAGHRTGTMTVSLLCQDSETVFCSHSRRWLAGGTSEGTAGGLEAAARTPTLDQQ